MTKRIFWSIFFVAITVLLACLVLFMGGLYTYFAQVQMHQLRNETLMTAQALTVAREDYFQNLSVEGCRITWIAPDGTVLFDNEAGYHQMANHLEREEIQEAIATGEGESSRYSDTKMKRYLYCARKLGDGSILRLSTEHSTVFNLVLEMLEPIVVVIAAAVGLSLVLAGQVSRRIVRPLNNMNLDAPLENREYPEITPLLQRMDAQQQHLRLQSARLTRKQNEFDAVVCSMGEGLILLNIHAQILTMNRAASELLNARWYCKGDEFFKLEQASRIQDLVRKALAGQGGEKLVAFHGATYQVDVTPVQSAGAVSGAVVLIFDVTEKQKAEAMRREFTANVSHELKTPLQSISGYAELLSCGIARAEDVQTFSSRIYREAQRMIRLVEDIIRLSHLDEGTTQLAWETVDLLEVAREAAGELSDVRNAGQVTVTVTGQPVKITGIRQQVLAIAVNLCSNAVKYNNPGGKVQVHVSAKAEAGILTVRDTGIGISPEHQQRIFERFYRVDKSHSKEVGGTGLGLSIVKHAAQIHHADIHLDSAPGQGTTVTVRFPVRQDRNGPEDDLSEAEHSGI